MRMTADQVVLLARRSVLRTWRNPAATRETKLLSALV